MLSNRRPFEASTLGKLLHMQLHQIPPDIKQYCPGIDEDFAELIQKSLAKDVSDRISDWEQIRKILRLVDRRKSIPLEADEMGVTIRLQNTSYRQSTELIHAIQKVLEDAEVKFSIEMQRGDVGDKDSD
jgi:serine/threonine protein kinase